MPTRPTIAGPQKSLGLAFSADLLRLPQSAWRVTADSPRIAGRERCGRPRRRSDGAREFGLRVGRTRALERAPCRIEIEGLLGKRNEHFVDVGHGLGQAGLATRLAQEVAPVVDRSAEVAQLLFEHSQNAEVWEPPSEPLPQGMQVQREIGASGTR